MGEPAQEVDVLVSTGSSELWLVENTGCASTLFTLLFQQGKMMRHLSHNTCQSSVANSIA